MTTFQIAWLFLGIGILSGIFISTKKKEEWLEKKNDEIRENRIELEFAKADAENSKKEVAELKQKLENIASAKSNGCTPSDACVGCKYALYDTKLSSGQTGFICTKNPPCEGFERKEKVNMSPIYSSLAHPMLDAIYFSCQNAIRR